MCGNAAVKYKEEVKRWAQGNQPQGKVRGHIQGLNIEEIQRYEDERERERSKTEKNWICRRTGLRNEPNLRPASICGTI